MSETMDRLMRVKYLERLNSSYEMVIEHQRRIGGYSIPALRMWQGEVLREKEILDEQYNSES